MYLNVPADTAMKINQQLEHNSIGKKIVCNNNFIEQLDVHFLHLL